VSINVAPSSKRIACIDSAINGQIVIEDVSVRDNTFTRRAVCRFAIQKKGQPCDECVLVSIH
jgi:DNA-binding transcriptional regulator YdaS (Cro superfamily)